jgi:RecA/RadA recombinase
MADFLKNILEEIKDEDTNMASDGCSSAEFGNFIDTGSYSLNALFSSSIYGGIPDNKVSCLAGVESVGKTYYLLSIIRTFLGSNTKAGAIIYDSEDAITKELIEKRGIDSRRIILVNKHTVQEWKFHALKFLAAYEASEDKPPMLMALDSLGQLSTTKEMEDSLSGNDVKDMTRTQAIKAAFRTIGAKLGKNHIPLIVTNHVYQLIGAYVPTKEMSGGSGIKYTASQIVFLSKKKDTNKETKEILGNIITAKIIKSRVSREYTVVETKINYDGGIDKYYGLLPIAEAAGIFKRVSTQYDLGNGVKVFGKEILENPAKYFTKGVLDELELYVNKAYAYLSEEPVAQIEE